MTLPLSRGLIKTKVICISQKSHNPQKITITIAITKMSNKNAIPVLLIATLVVASAFMQTGEALSECAKPCMPVCLNEKGATIPVCETACEEYCIQASGSDPSQGPVGKLFKIITHHFFSFWII